MNVNELHDKCFEHELVHVMSERNAETMTGIWGD